MTRPPDWRVLDRLAVRAWTAAERIDAIRGGRKAWDWTWRQVVRLTREGRQSDPEAVRPIVDALEERLERERRRRQVEGSP